MLRLRIRDLHGETDIVSVHFSIFSVLIVFPPPLSAENAGIRDSLVTNNANHVLVYARVTNCFTKDIEAAILAGVPTTFTFILDLFQERSWWLDKKLSRATINHTIKYDNVKKLFYVSSDGEKEATLIPRILRAPSGRWPI